MIDKHKGLLEKLEEQIDLDHVEKVRQLHKKLWAGEDLPYIPVTMAGFRTSEWPVYKFTECWKDCEKNIFNSLGYIYEGTRLKDDRVYQIRPEYGVVNIPELFGIETIITDEGKSMSEGLNNTDAIKRILDKGVPDFKSNPHTRKIIELIDFAKSLLKPYPKLSEAVSFTLPDTQGPFDLACLIWGSDIFMGIYDHVDLLKDLLELLTETYIRYNTYFKGIIDEPMDSATHIAGLPLLKGGVRICDDSATLISPDTYENIILPYNEKAFEPFNGGWVHYCGNGNHLLPYIFSMKGVNALHLGNPDMHDLRQILIETGRKGIVLFWSGALEQVPELMAEKLNSRLLILVENRYSAKDIDDAKWRVDQVRQAKPIPKADW